MLARVPGRYLEMMDFRIDMNSSSSLACRRVLFSWFVSEISNDRFYVVGCMTCLWFP